MRYNDERRRGRSWSGFEVEKDCTVRRDPVSVAAFTKAIRDRFDTPHVHVDIFDRHRVILDDQECDLVQVAVYREGRPEDMLGFDANSTLSRRIVKPVFEAALTYEADSRDDLARKVIWVSEEEGDGAGYDIESFEPDGRPRLIEVKTTNGWERTPLGLRNIQPGSARR